MRLVKRGVLLLRNIVFDRRQYAFDVPGELIAQQAAARGRSRLLHLRCDGTVADLQFNDVLTLLPPHSVLVLNDTRVLPARVLARSPGGGAVELFFLRPTEVRNQWQCLVRAKRPVRPGQFVLVGESERLTFASPRQGDSTVAVDVPGDVLPFLSRFGQVPLPPYIERAPGPEDADRYQTVFAKREGAVAAPTAGLHFTEGLLNTIRAAGHDIATLTLHVGLGTFAPMRSDDIREHVMHVESYEIPATTATLIGTGRPIVAVGTTVLRALESAARGPSDVRAGPGTTNLFVYPGGSAQCQIVNHLITNFHLPESTLLMLVCAFAGTDHVLSAYRHAVTQRYRFFSYGDAMWVDRCA